MVRVQLGFDIETFSGLTCGGFMCSFHSQPYSDLHRFNKITKNRKWTNVSCHLHVHFFFMTYIRFSHMQTDALLLCLNKATFLQEFFFLTQCVNQSDWTKRWHLKKLALFWTLYCKQGRLTCRCIKGRHIVLIYNNNYNTFSLMLC